MRKIIEIVAGRNIDLTPHGIDLSVHTIERLWTVYDLEKLFSWCKFDPMTGKPVVFTDIEDVPLRHREGIFLEDRIHDWNVHADNLLDYYSRVTKQGEPVKILIEYK